MPSEKILEAKKQLVREMSEKVKSAKSIILADYRGLTVDQDTKLRKAMREAGIEYKVVKNSITAFAAKENGLDDLTPFLNGPTAVAMSDTDAVAPAKVLAKFAKDFTALEIKAGVVEGKVVNVAEVNAIAELPSKEELIAKVVGGLNGPIYGFANVLSANLRGLVVALNAIAEKKGA